MWLTHPLASTASYCVAKHNGRLLVSGPAHPTVGRTYTNTQFTQQALDLCAVWVYIPLSMIMDVPFPLCVAVYSGVKYGSGVACSSAKWYSCGLLASAIAEDGH